MKGRRTRSNREIRTRLFTYDARGAESRGRSSSNTTARRRTAFEKPRKSWASAVRLGGCDRDHIKLAFRLLSDFRPRFGLCVEVSNTMKIRVIIRCSTVTPEFVRHSMWNVFKQMSCRVAGHRAEIEVTSGRLALKCARCGWESPGWRIDPRGSSGMGMTSRARA